MRQRVSLQKSVEPHWEAAAKEMILPEMGFVVVVVIAAWGFLAASELCQEIKIVAARRGAFFYLMGNGCFD